VDDALPIVALDTETTSLAPTVSRYGRRAWEFAAIRRDLDGRMSGLLAHVQLPSTRMEHADPEALEIGGYYARAPWSPRPVVDFEATKRWHYLSIRNHSLFQPRDIVTYRCVMLGDGHSQYQLGLALIEILRGATVVGSNPGFDTENVSAFLHDAGLPLAQLAPWHYKPYDIAQHGSAALNLPGPGPSTKDLSARYGIDRPVEHTGLADAAWALAMRDEIEAFKQVRV
jgi:hypothetical protein